VKITFKLFATLSDYLPAGARSNMIELSFDGAPTVGQVIGDHQLPAKLVHLVLVNGNFVAPEVRSEHVLKDGDTLAIWPPIAGG
jgi:molybdopterin converting factor small subunit